MAGRRIEFHEEPRQRLIAGRNVLSNAVKDRRLAPRNAASVAGRIPTTAGVIAEPAPATESPFDNNGNGK